MRFLPSLVLAVVMTLAAAAPAFAHAHLAKSEPAKGAVLHTVPTTVILWFTEKLEPAFSTVEVLDGSGKRVDEGKATVDPADHTVLRIALKALPPGTYKAVWRVVSVDSHSTNGDFTFKVAP